MKIAYLLSNTFPYDRLICSDAGPAIASEYSWDACAIDDIVPAEWDAIVIDNRHHVSDELVRLAGLIRQNRRLLFLVRINDPFFFHIQDPWYQFCGEILSLDNVNILSPYQPVGLVSAWLSKYTRTSFVFAPFSYDPAQEIPIEHTGRKHRIALTGNQRKDLYPLRYKCYQASRIPVLSKVLGLERLAHPGYPEKIPRPSHSIIGGKYISWLSRYSVAFVDSTIYRIELLKYREIAYAGCAPIGDLPWSLYDCPSKAFYSVDGMQQLVRWRFKVFPYIKSEAAAKGFREFMRERRLRSIWRNRVKRSIEFLL